MTLVLFSCPQQSPLVIIKKQPQIRNKEKDSFNFKEEKKLFEKLWISIKLFPIFIFCTNVDQPEI